MDKKHTIVVGIDHGYGYMKTARTIFQSGLKELPVKPPLSNKILEFEDQVYAVGQCRQNHAADKTKNRDYYLLTLAALAEELKARGKRRAEVIIAAGLPYSFLTKQKEDFKRYLLEKKELQFLYEDKEYKIFIKGVHIFPQGFPIIADKLENMTGTQIVVDVGSRTIDVLTFIDKEAQHGFCFSMPGGVIDCIEDIQNAFMSKYQRELPEKTLQEFLQGKDLELPEEYKAFLEKMARFYVRTQIFGELEAKGIALEGSSVTYCGGGATAVKRFGQYADQNAVFITNIHANAQGYEYLCKGILRITD